MDFSFRQRLNNFAKTGDSSGLIFLRITTELLSGTFLGSKLLIGLETSWAVIKNIIEIVLSDTGKVRKDMSSAVQY